MYIKEFMFDGKRYHNVPIDGLAELGVPENQRLALITQAQQAAAKAQIAGHIYRYYSAQQQAQDEKWTSSYLLQLEAVEIPQLKPGLMTLFSTTEPIAEQAAAWIATWPSEILEKLAEEKALGMLLKLTKIARRTAWAEACVTEGKRAIVAGEPPVYPAYAEYTNE